jgi:hypothetical protein
MHKNGVLLRWIYALAIGLILLAAGWIFLLVNVVPASAVGWTQAQITPAVEVDMGKSSEGSQAVEAMPTPTPARAPVPAGGNAGLVCGASLLVIITIGGVIWTNSRRKAPKPAA